MWRKLWGIDFVMKIINKWRCILDGYIRNGTIGKMKGHIFKILVAAFTRNLFIVSINYFGDPDELMKLYIDPWSHSDVFSDPSTLGICAKDIFASCFAIQTRRCSTSKSIWWYFDRWWIYNLKRGANWFWTSLYLIFVCKHFKEYELRTLIYINPIQNPFDVHPSITTWHLKLARVTNCYRWLVQLFYWHRNSINCCLQRAILPFIKRLLNDWTA